jgi:adenosylcobyric acid synthase
MNVGSSGPVTGTVGASGPAGRDHLCGSLMVCGTASDVGKSALVTGLCRLLARRGVSVAPFKGQNMSLNSAVTGDGKEIGRAQAAQAAAAGAEPEAAMNPVLLKPTSDRRSQVVVMGRPWATWDAAEFHRRKPELRDIVTGALGDLRRRFDVVICEGAGSPAEINLMDGDLVNLGLATAAGVPAVVVGDIDRGGVFAHLHGTVSLLPEALRRSVRGFVINKFRGDPALLGDASVVLERRCGVPTLGVIPWLGGVGIDAEDSLALRTGPWSSGDRESARRDWTGTPLDVAVLSFPRLANFTDLDPLRLEPGVHLRWVDGAGALGDPDLVILPGTKATVGDLGWLRRTGLDEALDKRRAGRDGDGPVVLGICGGFQMLGSRIEDPHGVESDRGSVAGLGLCEVVTRFAPEKTTRRRSGRRSGGGPGVQGYEIHHGQPSVASDATTWLELDPDGLSDGGAEGVADAGNGLYGTSLHGVFECDEFRSGFLSSVAERRCRAWVPSGVSFAAARQGQIDRLADACEQHLDIDALCSIIEGGRLA